MSKFRLFIISPLGKCTEVLSGINVEILKAAGEELIKKNPGIQFGITNKRGSFIWPKELKRNKSRQIENYLSNLAG